MDSKLFVCAVTGGVVGGLSALALYCLKSHVTGSKHIKRIGTENPRGSKIVIYNNTVHLSGQVANIDTLGECDAAEQTRQTLAKVDGLLALAGTSKSKIVEARIWLRDISRDFIAMNGVWNNWVDADAKGARYCVGAPLARENILVEISIVAAL